MTTSPFSDFATLLSQRLKLLEKSGLFLTSAPADDIWEKYLSSFPTGSNPLFRERTEHDCSCCRHFIRTLGAAGTINPNSFAFTSIWRGSFPEPYATVASALASFVESFPTASRFYNPQKLVGTEKNHETLATGEILTWHHLSHQLHSSHTLQKDQIPSRISSEVSAHSVILRGLSTFSLSAIETVLSLIDENNLYRGTENKKKIQDLFKQKKTFDRLPETLRPNFCWTLPPASAIRNSSIGTLISDLSAGMDLEKAVQSYESKVAPQNYKRSSALVTKSMIEEAKATISSFGLESAIFRRHATEADLPISAILHTNKRSTLSLSPFDDLIQDAPIAKKAGIPKAASTIRLPSFLDSILPHAKKVEIFFDNSNIPNLVNLTTATDESAKNLFPWPNPFAWTYKGNATDSIKERVKSAGGDISGALRFSLAWDYIDDLDLHGIMPDKTHIYYNNKRSAQACLDVDQNVTHPLKTDPVENLTWKSPSNIRPGTHEIAVHNYTKRDQNGSGFQVEMEYQNKVQTFTFDKSLREGEKIPVIRFEILPDKTLKILSSLPSTQTSKKVWNIPTMQFHETNFVTLSPNHWDETSSGAAHLFFFIPSCANDEPCRGFYNEFLSSSVQKHRKALELLASRMTISPDSPQLAGLGFALTKRASFLCRIDNRPYKVEI